MSRHAGYHRTGVTRMVAILMSVAAMAVAPAVMPSLATTAHAAGSITINKSDDRNGSVSYKAYLIFTGTVDSSGQPKMSNLAWKDAATRTKVVAAIKSVDPSYQDPANDAESAQLAAERIVEGIKVGSAPSSNQSLIVTSDSFAKALADQLAGLAAVDTVTPGTKKSLQTDGYYLFVSTDLNGAATGTSPIFTVIGANNSVEVTEKTSVPRIDKHLQRENGSWGRATDREMDEAVRYRILTTLPINLTTFSSYNHKVTDALPTGLTPVQGSIEVRAYDTMEAALADANGTGGTVITTDTGVSAAFSGQTMTMEIANVKALTKVTATPDTTFATFYTSKVNTGLPSGSTGSINGATLTYSNDPMSDGKGTQESEKTKVYNYQLSLHKQDKANASRALQGAAFTLKLVTDDGTSANNGKYVQADGSLGTAEHRFQTDANGNFSVKGLDSGTYLLSEVSAPPATNGGTYERVAGTTIVITGNPESDGMQVPPASQQFTLSATKNGPADVFIAETVDAAGTASGGVNTSTGNVPVVVRDTKTVLMPLTGQAGIAAFVTAGVVVAIAAVRLLVPGKRDDDQEDLGE